MLEERLRYAVRPHPNNRLIGVFLAVEDVPERSNADEELKGLQPNSFRRFAPLDSANQGPEERVPMHGFASTTTIGSNAMIKYFLHSPHPSELLTKKYIVSGLRVVLHYRQPQIPAMINWCSCSEEVWECANGWQVTAFIQDNDLNYLPLQPQEPSAPAWPSHWEIAYSPEIS
jgi:hypothetical protein